MTITRSRPPLTTKPDADRRRPLTLRKPGTPARRAGDCNRCLISGHTVVTRIHGVYYCPSCTVVVLYAFFPVQVEQGIDVARGME
jgi:hypothetical protein